MNKEFILHSDVEVFSIPDGEKILLKKGIPGIITQSLGNNFTIVVEGNMYQVKGSDAETIGEEKKSIVSNNFANKEEVWNILQTCYDPEIPVNIVDLGLVYDCTISEEKDGVSVSIQMTLTAPGCGMGPVMAAEVKEKILSFKNILKKNNFTFVTNKTDEQISSICSICFERSRDRLLPCGHIFCLSCIKRNVDIYNKGKCFDCRKQYSIEIDFPKVYL